MSKDLKKFRERIQKTNYHLIFCYPKKNCLCSNTKKIKASLSELKIQLKHLKKLGIYCSLTTSSCLKICKSGPVLVVHPEGVWYHSCSPKVIQRIVDLHLTKNKIVKENLIGIMNIPKEDHEEYASPYSRFDNHLFITN